MWLKAGVFAAVSPAVMKLDEARVENVRFFEAAVNIAFFAFSVIRRSEGGFMEPWQAVVDSGMLLVLNKRIMERCENGEIITILKWALNKGTIDGGPQLTISELFSSFNLSTTETPKSDESPEPLKKRSASSTFFWFDDFETCRSALSEREAVILDSQRDDTSRRRWPCSNPSCSSITSQTVRMIKCKCLMSRYCSLSCERVDWAVHRRTCAARKKN